MVPSGKKDRLWAGMQYFYFQYDSDILASNVGQHRYHYVVVSHIKKEAASRLLIGAVLVLDFSQHTDISALNIISQYDISGVCIKYTCYYSNRKATSVFLPFAH